MPLIRDTMKTLVEKARQVWLEPRTRRLLLLGSLPVLLLGLGAGIVLMFWTLPVFGGHLTSVLNPNAALGMIYFHDSERKVPWSMHVVKISRMRKDLEMHSVMGGGTNQGMTLVSEQIKRIPPEWGRPVAAFNGDLYNEHPDYPGDPEGLQIVHGELVSGPSPTRVCCWIDAEGNPHRDDVRSRFAVTWPDGSSTPFGLNQALTNSAVVLYTSALGPSTRTHAGLELVLERNADQPWLPLEIGRTCSARIRSLSEAGNSPLTRDTLVLALGADLAKRTPKVGPGEILHLSTETAPLLAGVRTAIGGGPTLVAEGKARGWDGLNLRHPRTAIGWNNDHLFLVVVDGRQLRVSLGMTFPELADYLVKLGCQEAIALDGGGSTTCWAYGNIMNSPSQGRPRPAANALVVLQTARRTR